MRPTVLLVGCGEHAQENLIPSLASIGAIDVKGVCDNDQERLDRAARWFPLARKLLSDQLREDDLRSFDAVVVAAPPQVHADVSRTAIALGKAIFVEKPPTVSTAELVELARLAKKARVVSCVGHNLRHSEAAIHFRNCVIAPSFGRPVAMEMRYFASKPRGTRWGLESPLRSFLLSHANHAIDFMIYQMGEIQQVVAARAWPEKNDGIAIAAQFIFKSGAVGSLLASSYAPHFSVAATVISDAAYTVSMNGLNEVQVHDNPSLGKRWGSSWRARTLETGFRFAGYQTELERFFAAIASGSPEEVHPSFADEVAIYEAMDVIEASIERSSP